MAIARGAKVWATPWSPTASLKSNGSVDNGGTLLQQNYSTWADSLVNYVKTAAQNGVPIYAISMQNEPDQDTAYDSCQFSASQMTSFIKVAGPKLAALNPRPLLIMPEPAFWGDLWAFTSSVEADSTAAPLVDIYGVHLYGGIQAPQTKAKPIWETESSTIGDTFDPTMTSGISVAEAIHDSIVTGGVTAWHFWWLIASGTDDEGLVGKKGDLAGSPTLTKRLYTMGNFSKFVRPGFIRVSTTGGPGGAITVAFKNPNTGQPVLVAINYYGSNVSIGVTLQGVSSSSVTPWQTSASLNLVQQSNISISNGRFTATLPGSSVTTFVGNP